MITAIFCWWHLPSSPQVYSDCTEPLPDQTSAGQTRGTGHKGHLRMRPNPPAKAPTGGASQVPALPPHQEVRTGPSVAVFMHDQNKNVLYSWHSQFKRSHVCMSITTTLMCRTPYFRFFVRRLQHIFKAVRGVVCSQLVCGGDTALHAHTSTKTPHHQDRRSVHHQSQVSDQFMPSIPSCSAFKK